MLQHLHLPLHLRQRPLKSRRVHREAIDLKGVRRKVRAMSKVIAVRVEGVVVVVAGVAAANRAATRRVRKARTRLRAVVIISMAILPAT
jgi:hypothetical protein